MSYSVDFGYSCCYQHSWNKGRLTGAAHPKERIMLGKSLLAVAVVASLMPLAGSAAVLLSDDFSYADGPLIAVSSGKWKKHSGTAEQVEVLGGQVKLSQKNTEDVNAAFPDGPIGPTNAAALYARFAVSFSALPSGSNGTYFAHFKDGSATTGLRGRMFVLTNGAGAGHFRLGIAAGAATASAILEQDLVLNTNYTVVCRMALSDNTSTLWLNPSSELDSGVTSTDSVPPKAAVAFALREALGSPGGMGELTVDDLVIATSFAEVIAPGKPEGLMLSITCDPIAGVQLHWPAHPECTYSVLAAASPGDAWSVIALGLWFPDGIGWYAEPWTDSLMSLYQVSSP
jgi:hypothetical protein